MIPRKCTKLVRTQPEVMCTINWQKLTKFNAFKKVYRPLARDQDMAWGHLWTKVGASLGKMVICQKEEKNRKKKKSKNVSWGF